MRLSQALASQVSNSCRSRGASYAVTGAVRDLTHENGVVHAIVRGNSDYDVWIDQEGASLRGSCTCPFFSDRVEVCKHIWAVVLTAEAKGIPLVAPGTLPGRLVLEPFDDFDETFDDDLDDDTSTPAPAARTKRGSVAPPASRPRAVPAPWQTMLEAIASTPAGHPAAPRFSAGQLLYVLDVGVSLQARTAVIELMARDRKKSGEWSKPRPARLSSRDLPMLPPGPDRTILERLAGAAHDYGSYGYAPALELSRVRLHGTVMTDVLPLMCAEGRCLARVTREEADAHAVLVAAAARVWQQPQAKRQPPELLPLVFDGGTAWRFQVAVHRDEEAQLYRLDGWLARGEERMAISEPLLVFADGLLATRTAVARLDHQGAFPWLAALRRHGAVAIPFSARPALIDALLAQPLEPSEAPDDLRLTIEEASPRPSLRLAQGTWRDRLEATVAMIYDEAEISPLARQPLVRIGDGTRVIRRDLRRERELLDRLRALGFRDEWSQRAQAPVPQLLSERLPRTVRTLLDEGWHVEAAGVTYRTPGAIRMSVSSGIDWFDVTGSVEYGEQRVPLPALLAAVRRGDGFVALGDGTQGLLPEEWLRTSGALARMGVVAGDSLRFKPSQVALLDALLAVQPSVTCDEVFARARTQLAAFDGITAADPPASFTGTLRGYQREGLGWLLFLRRFGFGGCLADDMGLGKTVMVLALLARLGEEADTNPAGPSLVVAPRSLVFNWRQEAARFTPGLRVMEYTGAGRSALRDGIDSHDLVLTTYGTLRRDAAHLASVPFEYVVLDEAQAIKNAGSASAKAARLLQSKHRLALSGTPVENHLGELWSIFEFLNPGVLGSSAAFGAATGGGKLDDEAIALLSRGLRPFILRRTKEQVAPELPAKTEQTVYCELERPQRMLYDELRAHYRHALLDGRNGTGLGRAKLQVLEALLRLRQAACHPGLIDPKRAADGAAKLDVLIPRILESVEEGHKTLVFSQFTSLLAIVRRALDAAGVTYEYLDGRTRDREQRVARFQTEADCRLFLISLKAGGVGLNLTAAEYVFLLDPWWNPAVEAQAIDRTHRIGQSRHVFAYRLIAKDTVEERVLELQQRKRTLADAILTADEGLLRSLKREDLELLLS